jgi:hypothetical protein
VTAYGWPFLVARTRNAGHRVVVAPDFLVEQEAESWLGRVSGGEDTPDGHAVLHQSPDGQFVVVSRVFVAGRADYGLDGDGPIRDRSGRPIRFTEGLVLRGHTEPEVTQGDLAQACSVTQVAYQTFWTLEDAFQTVPSTGYPLGTTPGTALTLRPARSTSGPAEPRPKTPAHGHERRVRLTVAGVAAAGLVGAVLLLSPNGNSGTSPRTTAPTEPSSCAEDSCPVTPAQLVTEAHWTLTPGAEATVVTDHSCRTDGNPAVLLTGTNDMAGTWQLNWSEHTDLSGYTDAVLTVTPRTGVDTLELVIEDTNSNRRSLPMELNPNQATPQDITVSLTGLKGVDLTSVRTLGLHWPATQESASELCLSSITFR